MCMFSIVVHKVETTVRFLTRLVFLQGDIVVFSFIYCNKIGLDIALESLREGLRAKRVTPDQL